MSTPGYIEGPRFSPITPDDQAGAIWVGTLLLVVYSAVALFARLYIKSSALDNDDHTLTVGTVCLKGVYPQCCVQTTT